MRRRTVLATIAAAATLSGVGGFAFAGAEATCAKVPASGGAQTGGRYVCTPETGDPVQIPRVPRLPYVPGGPGEVEPADPTRTARGVVNRGIDAGNAALADVWEAGQILGGTLPIGPVPLPKRPELPHI